MFILKSAAVLAFTLTTTAQASSLESCLFEGTVESIQSLGILGESVPLQDQKTIALVRIDSASDRGSHNSEACQRFVGSLQGLERSGNDFDEGDSLTLSYFHANSITPDGVRGATEWNLIDH